MYDVHNGAGQIACCAMYMNYIRTSMTYDIHIRCIRRKRISKLILIDSRHSEKANPEAYIWYFLINTKLVDGWSVMHTLYPFLLVLKIKPSFSLAISEKKTLFQPLKKFSSAAILIAGWITAFEAHDNIHFMYLSSILFIWRIFRSKY